MVTVLDLRNFVFGTCLLVLTGTVAQPVPVKKIEKLIAQWAPLVWLAPNEQYFPISVNDFLKNVRIATSDGQVLSGNDASVDLFGNASKYLHLVTKEPLESLMSNKSSIIHGKNPKENSVPIYAVVTQCTPHPTFHSTDLNNLKNEISVIYGQQKPYPHFHVTYWMFYPYNEGKDICFIGKVPTPLLFNTCFGKRKKFGNHVGDWEHMSLSFRGKPYPEELFLAVHNIGVYYKYSLKSRLFRYNRQVMKKSILIPKYPPIVKLSGTHPILFSASGSHGLWSAPGEHDYVRVPRLFDNNGYGIPWKTWNNLEVFQLGSSKLAAWLNFKGKWGNPKTNCFLFHKLGICELFDGPSGILMRPYDFNCSTMLTRY